MVMKRLVYVLAMFLWLWPACSGQQKSASLNENKEAEAARQEKQMYQDKIEAKLRDLDQRIAALKVKVEKEKKVDRKEIDQELEELDRKRAILRQELEKLKSSTELASQDMKAGIDAAMEDLEAAYERAAAHFK